MLTRPLGHCLGALAVGYQAYNPTQRAGTDPVAVNLEMSPDALMDDWAMFSGALTAAEIAERWDKSLTARLAANLEPNLAIFYNFNDPLPPVGGTMVRLRQSNLPPHLMLCGAPAVPLRCAPALRPCGAPAVPAKRSLRSRDT